MENQLKFFVSPEQQDLKFKTLLHDASSSLCDWFASTSERPPIPTSIDLPGIEPLKDGITSKQILDDLETLMAGSYQPSHPGALAHLDPPPLKASIIAELIAAGLNNNLLAEELSPSITRLERALCKWLAKQLGMPCSAGGVSASGGSLTNLMALFVARSSCKARYDSNAVVMASSDAHVSIARAISILGLPPEACLKVSTDDEGKIEINSLKEQYSLLKSKGKKCFAVVATAGTTVRGAIDPLIEIADFCSHEGLWLHVDAAIGGVFALSDSTCHLLNGISKADSVTLNPQKLLGITKTSSLLLVAKMDDLFDSFSTGFPYLEPSDGGDFQGGELGLQGSRPAEILKLWLGLRQLGIRGIRDLLENSLERRSYFQNKLDHNKLKVISGPLHLLAITARHKDDIFAEEWSIATKSMLINHEFMLSRPKYESRFYLKAVLGNPHTTTSHLDQLALLINQSISLGSYAKSE